MTATKAALVTCLSHGTQMSCGITTRGWVVVMTLFVGIVLTVAYCCWWLNDQRRGRVGR